VHDLKRVECRTADGLKLTEEIIGQDRAQRALHFGLEIQEQGFYLHVASSPRTGRHTAVRNFIYEMASDQPKADDWVYVNNFTNQYEPIAIRLPAGMALQFKADMAAFIDEAKTTLPRAFESEEYVTKNQETLGKLGKEREDII